MTWWWAYRALGSFAHYTRGRCNPTNLPLLRDRKNRYSGNPLPSATITRLTPRELSQITGRPGGTPLLRKYRPTLWKAKARPARAPSGSQFFAGIRTADNLLDLIEADPIELGNLCRRHPVVCQSSDATELRREYLGHRFRGDCTFPLWLPIIGRLAVHGAHRWGRPDRQDAWSSRRLLLR